MPMIDSTAAPAMYMAQAKLILTWLRVATSCVELKIDL